MGVAGFANPMAPVPGQVGVQEPVGLWERRVVQGVSRMAHASWKH